jgi:hypothetical protein
MLKACQYVINETKVGVGMKKVCLFKMCKLSFKKQSFGLKKPKKGKQEWEKTCHEIGTWRKKLKTFIKTCFVSKVILFQKTLEYSKNTYYMQKTHLCKLRFQASFTTLAIMGAMKKECAHQTSIVLPL